MADIGLTIGAVVERPTCMGSRRFIVTEHDFDEGMETFVLTPIPDGMTELDLGRKFPGAIVEWHGVWND